eukprot:gene11538-27596_t
MSLDQVVDAVRWHRLRATDAVGAESPDLGVSPSQALKQYRAATGIDARLIAVAITSGGFTLVDPAVDADKPCTDGGLKERP